MVEEVKKGIPPQTPEMIEASKALRSMMDKKINNFYFGCRRKPTPFRGWDECDPQEI
jgi:hypothetical protein